MTVTKQEIIDSIKDIAPIDEIDIDGLVALAESSVECGRLEDTKEAILSFIKLAL